MLLYVSKKGRIVMSAKNYINFLGNEELPTPLKEEELRKLFPIARAGNTNVRNYIIEKNTRLVIYYISRRYHKTESIDINELVSIGMLSLILATENFDVSKNNTFASYAISAIENNINKYLNKENKQAVGQLHLNTSQIEIITNPEDKILEEEKADTITQIIEQLPPHIKEVIKMKYGFYNKVYTNIEISKIMKISTNTVVTRANKGLKIIKELLLESQIYEENTGLKPIILENNLYDYFQDIPKDKVKEALTILTDEEISTLNKIFTMKNPTYLPRRKVINKDVQTVEKTIIPKLKTILKNK